MYIYVCVYVCMLAMCFCQCDICMHVIIHVCHASHPCFCKFMKTFKIRHMYAFMLICDRFSRPICLCTLYHARVRTYVPTSMYVYIYRFHTSSPQ